MTKRFMEVRPVSMMIPFLHGQMKCSRKSEAEWYLYCPADKDNIDNSDSAAMMPVLQSSADRSSPFLDIFG